MLKQSAPGEAAVPKVRARRKRPRSAGGHGPPVAQSINSTVWTVGSFAPAAVCVMQPILPAAITSGRNAAIAAGSGSRAYAWSCIGEAMTAVETTKERWHEAEVRRVAGEIALKSPEPDAAKAEAYFERALAVARKQQAKSWELRAAMSMARLWRDQGKPQQARELLGSVYGWFTEGFDTLDLKEAKTLLDELAKPH